MTTTDHTEDTEEPRLFHREDAKEAANFEWPLDRINKIDKMFSVGVAGVAPGFLAFVDEKFYGRYGRRWTP